MSNHMMNKGVSSKLGLVILLGLTAFLSGCGKAKSGGDNRGAACTPNGSIEWRAESLEPVKIETDSMVVYGTDQAYLRYNVEIFEEFYNYNGQNKQYRSYQIPRRKFNSSNRVDLKNGTFYVDGQRYGISKVNSGNGDTFLIDKSNLQSSMLRAGSSNGNVQYCSVEVTKAELSIDFANQQMLMVVEATYQAQIKAQ